MSGFFGSSRGGRRKMADNLNLVPFIDLFSTMIIFLLATAVWDQLASVKASLGQSSGDANISVPQEPVKKIEARLKMTITDKYVELFDAGKTQRLAIADSVFDIEPVTEFMLAARERYPDKSDVVIQATDNAKYEHLIAVMDQALSQDFSELVITGIGGN